MEMQRLLTSANLKTEAEVEQHFQELAKKSAAHPGAEAKVLFTLACFK